MTKEYRSWVPEQSYLLPPSPMDWLPEGHLAYFVLELVGELDVSRIEEAIQSKDGRGTRPYSPRMMTALLLYAYCVGVFSSRKVERATYEDVAFRAARIHTSRRSTRFGSSIARPWRVSSCRCFGCALARG